jgi:SAM-dependent methyltransferase
MSMNLVEAWEAEALSWAAFTRTPGHDRFHERINFPAFLELVPEPGDRTLDVGCGEGRVGRTLLRLGHRIMSVDAAPTMARLAATHSVPQAVSVADAVRLPFRDRFFDCVTAYMSLHDMDDVSGAVAEIARVLSPGGYLCAAVLHPIASAGGFGGEGPDAPFTIPASYLESRRIDVSTERDGIAMKFHMRHRPLEMYVGALEAAGMAIDRLREPSPPRAFALEDASVARWARIPCFLHFRAVRA